MLGAAPPATHCPSAGCHQPWSRFHFTGRWGQVSARVSWGAGPPSTAPRHQRVSAPLLAWPELLASLVATSFLQRQVWGQILLTGAQRMLTAPRCCCE